MRRSAAVLVLALVALMAPAAGAQPAVDVRRDAPAPAPVMNIEYGTANGKRLLLDAYVPPAGEDRRPAVVMIHGGGWRAGDKASWRPEAEKLAAKGWVAFSVNYRLDEPAVFPAEIDDVGAAVRWVRAHAEEYRVDPARIGAIGESAGGHLTAMLATLGTGDLDRDARVRVGAAWSPPVDLTADHRLDVYPGNRHALDFRADAWAPTLAFLEKHLAATPVEGEASPYLEAAVAVTVLGAAGALLLRRRRTAPTAARP